MAVNAKVFPEPILGYPVEVNPPFGLTTQKRTIRKPRRKLVTHRGEAHIANIGPTGSGKTCQLLAAALSYSGSLISIDIGGDICRASYRFRQHVLGQKVHVIDPFSITGKPKARLDPLAVFSLPNVELESEAEALAAMLLADQRANTKDIFWADSAAALLAGDIAHSVRSTPPAKRTIQQTIDWMYGDDVAYEHGVRLDQNVKPGSFEHGCIAAWLQLPDSNTSGTRACVTATVHAAVSSLRSEAIRSCLGPSTVDLQDLLQGVPTTIYLVMPIEHLYAKSLALRLWLDTVLQALVRRPVAVNPPTLVMVDEMAQLGRLQSLLTMVTYCRNRSTKVWMACQDSGQIQRLYGSDFSTIVNNCSALLFNAGNHLAARELAAIAGVPLDSIADLKRGQQLVVETGLGSKVVEIPRYWRERFFAGRFDPLPRFERRVMEGGAGRACP